MMNNKMRSKCGANTTARMDDLQGYDENDSEQIFAWENDEARIRTNETVCPSCNSRLPTSSDPLDGPNCQNRRCGTCGYTVRLYGYDEAGYTDTFDDTDFVGAPDGRIEQPMPIDDSFTRRMWKPRMGPKSKFADDEEMMQRLAITNKKSGCTKSDRAEHMDYDPRAAAGGITFAVSFCIILLLIAYFIAYKRGELYNADGTTVNWSLVACILIFWQLYYGYVLVDWITKPNHGCQSI